MVTIIEFEEKYATDFRRMNMEWLDAYQLLESHDLLVLNDPQGIVLDCGGYIYLASAQEEIVGSAALVKDHGGQYELAKMYVAPSFRGQGISKLLLERCLEKAREIGAKKLILYSNSKL